MTTQKLAALFAVLFLTWGFGGAASALPATVPFCVANASTATTTQSCEFVCASGSYVGYAVVNSNSPNPPANGGVDCSSFSDSCTATIGQCGSSMSPPGPALTATDTHGVCTAEPGAITLCYSVGATNLQVYRQGTCTVLFADSNDDATPQASELVVEAPQGCFTAGATDVNYILTMVVGSVGPHFVVCCAATPMIPILPSGCTIDVLGLNTNVLGLMQLSPSDSQYYQRGECTPLPVMGVHFSCRYNQVVVYSPSTFPFTTGRSTCGSSTVSCSTRSGFGCTAGVTVPIGGADNGFPAICERSSEAGDQETPVVVVCTFGVGVNPAG